MLPNCNKEYKYLKVRPSLEAFLVNLMQRNILLLSSICLNHLFEIVLKCKSCQLLSLIHSSNFLVNFRIFHGILAYAESILMQILVLLSVPNVLKLEIIRGIKVALRKLLKDQVLKAKFRIDFTLCH